MNRLIAMLILCLAAGWASATEGLRVFHGVVNDEKWAAFESHLNAKPETAIKDGSFPAIVLGHIAAEVAMKRGLLGDLTQAAYVSKFVTDAGLGETITVTEFRRRAAQEGFYLKPVAKVASAAASASASATAPVVTTQAAAPPAATAPVMTTEELTKLANQAGKAAAEEEMKAFAAFMSKRTAKTEFDTRAANAKANQAKVTADGAALAASSAQAHINLVVRKATAAEKAAHQAQDDVAEAKQEVKKEVDSIWKWLIGVGIVLAAIAAWLFVLHKKTKTLGTAVEAVDQKVEDVAEKAGVHGPDLFDKQFLKRDLSALNADEPYHLTINVAGEDREIIFSRLDDNKVLVQGVRGQVNPVGIDKIVGCLYRAAADGRIEGVQMTGFGTAPPMARAA